MVATTRRHTRKHTLTYMTKEEGDVRQIWNPKNPEEVDVARQIFNDLIGKGYMAYTVRGRSNRGEQIREFNPRLGKIVLVPAMRGG